MPDTTKQLRLAAGDVVYVVRAQSFRVDVCRVNEIITRKSMQGVLTEYHVTRSSGETGPLEPDATVFRTAGELSKHLYSVAKLNIDKSIQELEAVKQRKGWETSTLERPAKEKTAQ